MITITYSKEDTALRHVLEKIISLSLAHQTVLEPTIAAIQLADGCVTVQGEAAIQQYLEELEGELRHWYYCSC